MGSWTKISERNAPHEPHQGGAYSESVSDEQCCEVDRTT